MWRSLAGNSQFPIPQHYISYHRGLHMGRDRHMQNRVNSLPKYRETFYPYTRNFRHLLFVSLTNVFAAQLTGRL